MAWQFALSRKIGLFEMLCADEAYKRLPFDATIDYVAVSREGVMRRYNSSESMDALAESIRSHDVATTLRELAKYDDTLSLVLKKDPYEAREEFIRAVENTWIYELYGYYVGVFSEDKSAHEEGERLRGTHNAQHESSTFFVPQLFKAVAEKTGIAPELIKYAKPEEIVSMEIREEDLRARQKFYVLT